MLRVCNLVSRLNRRFGFGRPDIIASISARKGPITDHVGLLPGGICCQPGLPAGPVPSAAALMTALTVASGKNTVRFLAVARARFRAALSSWRVARTAYLAARRRTAAR